MSAAELYDLAVIGGGVNGAGIARDAAGRGAKVLLLEAGDLAQGTSSASTKLIHGGLRYLEHYEFGLVRESLKEREALWAIAPHIIHPMRFVLPYVHGLRPRWLLRLGLFLYDHIGGRKRLPATRTIDLRQHPAGAALKGGFTTGFEYSDGWVDDARLVVLNAMDAAAHGATIKIRSALTAAHRSEGTWELTTATGNYRAKALVNAAGPGVLKVEGLLGDTPDYAMRLVRGSHIVVPKLFSHAFSYFFQLPDGRIFFAIPYQRDFTLIGTTDRDQAENAPIAASEEEIAYLCEGASRYFAQSITPGDVVWTYSGVRPLIDDGSGKPEAATRGYRLELSDPAKGAPLLSVYGGKITTYRTLAEAAVGKLQPHVAALAGGNWSDGGPLPGGDFPKESAPSLTAELARDYPFLGDDQALRLTRAYGTLAREVLGDAQTHADLGHDFGHGLSEREVAYLIENEWARTAEDVLWRRTKLGLRFSADEVAALETWMAERIMPHCNT
ncbi:glycerol-3-phosphate dehydrogenase [Novosphingobium sp.]|uniref:glycerol-3-phosphate dehydrogenase n=1 Tax=Novosphingobium sp. TaxID=1874826 RepID=UPI00286B7DE4|nr:glycerol-3-phosphate dehydrogenase [Novosphingobium sp.]